PVLEPVPQQPVHGRHLPLPTEVQGVALALLREPVPRVLAPRERPFLPDPVPVLVEAEVESRDEALPFPAVFPSHALPYRAHSTPPPLVLTFLATGRSADSRCR